MISSKKIRNEKEKMSKRTLKQKDDHLDFKLETKGCMLFANSNKVNVS